jgi:ABC-type antimicrobial peptide transport system permease subunit
LTVVGVVGDVRDVGDWRETWYLPYAQHASTLAAGNLHLMLRSPLPPDVLGRAVQQALRTVDARLPVPVPTPMTSLWTTGLEQQQLAASASALFGISGLLLAMMGTYGVLAYAVSARTREFGIRLALGAAAASVLRLVVRSAVVLGLAGVVAGLAAALALRQLIESRLFGISALDPVTLAAAGLAIVLLCVIASLVPALRAARIDPILSLRVE